MAQDRQAEAEVFEGTPLLRRPFRAAAHISDTCIGLEKDGFRAQLARYADGRVLPRSRAGTDMTAAFPKIQGSCGPRRGADSLRE
ncbi:hypothetical protein GCM10010095_77200 [Streptomyces anthocyanicus]|nr:hypothetical protein GCM10010095_77200 [Streptomyces anthocyanicus]